MNRTLLQVKMNSPKATQTTNRTWRIICVESVKNNKRSAGENSNLFLSNHAPLGGKNIVVQRGNSLKISLTFRVAKRVNWWPAGFTFATCQSISPFFFPEINLRSISFHSISVTFKFQVKKWMKFPGMEVTCENRIQRAKSKSCSRQRGSRACRTSARRMWKFICCSRAPWRPFL